MPPYINLFLSFINNFRNYISHSNILMKKRATAVFGRKVSQGYRFEIINSIQTFFIAV